MNYIYHIIFNTVPETWLFTSELAKTSPLHLSQLKKSLPVSVLVLASLGFSTTTYAEDIIANPNIVNTNKSRDTAYGVKKTTDNATGGVVKIENGGIIRRVYGGYSFGGSSTHNSINMDGGSVVKNFVFGGYSRIGSSTQNSVNMNGGHVNRSVYGGYSSTGNSTNNSLNINDGQVDRSVFGGHSENNNSTHNSVSMSGGRVKKSFYGGHSRRGSSTHNSINMSGGSVENFVFGGYSRIGSSTQNSVSMNDGRVNRSVYGGYSFTGNSSHNSVNMSGGRVDRSIFGGNSENDNSTHNSVNMSGGHVNRSVYGSYSRRGNSTNNRVNISGGYVNRNVYGSYSRIGNSTHNSVSISGNPTFGSNTILYGGNRQATGNILNLHTKNIRVKNIKNFENLYFYAPRNTTAGDNLLTLTIAGNTDISNTNNIGLALEGNDTQWKVGDQITLINKTGGLLNTGGISTFPNALNGLQGIAIVHNFTIAKQDNDIMATITGSLANPQVKSLSEARLAGIDFVNRGGDLAANTGLENLVKATQNGGIQGFAAIGGGKTRTETGSHIDVNGAHLMLGIGTQLPNASGTLTLGGFIEGGKGSYDSYNDFTNRPDVHASGDTHYYGVGLLAKQQFNNQWFIDGGLRLGKSHMDYYSSDLVNAAGNPTSFSGNSNYWGVNIGVGKDIELNEKNRLTPYAKLAYTHSSGDSQTIAGSTFDFSAMNSLRSRVGVRWTHQFNETSQFYTDAAWEHEFQGTAQGQVLGFAMPEPSLHGDTGIVNVGVNFTPNENLTIGVGAQGEFGKRNGVSATAKVTYSF